MRMIKAAAIAALFVAAASINGTAFAAEKDGIRLELGYFKPVLNFKAKHVVDSTAVTYDVDFKNEFKFPDKKAAEYRLWLNDNLRLSFTKWNFAGTDTLNQDVSYGDSAYNVGITATATLGVEYYRLTWVRPITRSAAFETSWLLDLKGFSFKTSITGQDSITGTVKTAHKEFKGVLPTIGVRAATKPGGADGRGISLFGEASGLAAGKYGYLYDLEAGVKIHFDKHSALSVAYRNFDINLRDGDPDGDKARLKQSGPYFELTHQF